MILVPKIVVQMLCLLSYLWVSTCLGDVLWVNHFPVHEPQSLIIFDEVNDSLIVHHKGHRDQHEPQAQENLKVSSDHVIKLIYLHEDLSSLTAKPSHHKVQDTEILFQYLQPPTVSYTTLAKTLLLAQQPPPTPPPISRNSSVAIAQLTRLRI